MKCPDEGTLLGYLDRELSPEEQRAVRQHLDYCQECGGLLRELEDHLDFSRERLGVLFEASQSAEVSGQDRVWASLQPVIRPRKRGKMYMNLKRWSVAAVVVLVVGITAYVPSFRTAVADMLQVFRAEKIETVTLSAQDIRDIQNALDAGSTNIDMKNFGRIETNGEPVERKLTRDELNSLPFRPLLPAGREGDYSLVQNPSVEITPRVDNVNRLLKSLGSQDLMPQALDGKTFTVTMADTFMADYSDFRLMEGTSPELQVPPGVDMKEVLRPLITLPIWPQGVREQLATIDDLEHTLVIPGEKVEKVSVQGTTGVISRDGGQAELIWQKDGLFYILSDKSWGKADLLAIAESMQ